MPKEPQTHGIPDTSSGLHLHLSERGMAVYLEEVVLVAVQRGRLRARPRGAARIRKRHCDGANLRAPLHACICSQGTNSESMSCLLIGRMKQPGLLHFNTVRVCGAARIRERHCDGAHPRVPIHACRSHAGSHMWPQAVKLRICHSCSFPAGHRQDLLQYACMQPLAF